MKALVISIIYLMMFSSLNAQEGGLPGRWSISEVVYTTEQGTQKVMEAEILDGSAVTEMELLADGTFTQSTNMTGSGNMENYQGKWKASGTELIFTLEIAGQVRDIVWTFDVKDNTLTLTRTNPAGTMKLVNAYRKK